MGLPLVGKREILKKLLPKEGSIRFSDAIKGRGTEFFHAANEVWRGSWRNEKKAGICQAPVGKLAQKQDQNAARSRDRWHH